MSIARRAFLRSIAGAIMLGASPARADQKFDTLSPPDLDVLDLSVEGDKKLAQRFLLLIPKHLAKDEKSSLLVLLHGLGETGDPTTGVHAWVERYGLGTAYARLRRPPIARTGKDTRLLPDARIAELNAALAAQPFRGMVIACPFTPSIGKMPDPARALDAYADWIADVVIPRARKEAPVIPDAAHTAIDGVSLGGYVGLEVFLRRASTFARWGGVQSAINAARVSAYADKLAAIAAKLPATPRGQAPFHIETSLLDPFHDVNRSLSRELAKRGVAHDFVALPGPHDQPFLRESGTMEMLLWHDRRFRP